MKKNQYITAGVVGLIIIIFAFVFLRGKESEKEVISVYPITNPWEEDLEIKTKYVAQIRAIQHIELRSLEKGYLQNIYVDEGQLVRKGQEMFQIMPILLETEFKKAKAEYDLARLEYENTKELQKHDVVSTNELALSQARLDKAKAQQDLAKAHLDLSTVKAPFDGMMDKFQTRLGSLLNEGELLTTLSDISRVWVYFNVSEADYLDYQTAKKDKKNANDKVIVELMLANGKLFSEKGSIDTIEADFDNASGNVAFRASFPNPDRLLRHGETGTVLLTKKYDDALVVPQEATFEVLDKKYVYTVDDKNTLHSQLITVAEDIPKLFIITSGITKKDKILVRGVGKVHAGETLETEYQDKDKVRENLELSVD